MSGPIPFGSLVYGEMDGVYSVERDTLFLIETFEREITGRNSVIDMGCGTGLLSLVAASKENKVLSIDREPRALELTRENLRSNGFGHCMFLSDLFEGLPRSYEGWADIITFNPPYLPWKGSGRIPREEIPLAGGRSGFELAFRFLSGASFFLGKRGKILLLGYTGWDISGSGPLIRGELGVTGEYRRDIDGESFSIWILSGPKKNIADMK